MVCNPNKVSPIVWWQYLPASGQPNNSDDIFVHNAVKFSQLCSTFWQILFLVFIHYTNCFVSFII